MARQSLNEFIETSQTGEAKLKRFCLVAISFLIGLGTLLPQASWAYEPQKKYEIFFYHVGDTHGYFYRSPKTGDGGFATLSMMVKAGREEARKKGAAFFLTSAGDAETGTPESDLLHAKPDFLAMNAIGFTAMALGNHEFDLPENALFKKLKWAGFPFLAANIRPKTPHLTPFRPYILREQKGLKVAFLGLTTEATKVLTPPKNTQDLIFDPAIETAKKWVPLLRKRADLIVAITHIGWCPEGKCNLPNDVRLAQEVPGIDLILGGHSHTDMEHPDVINGIPIVHTYEKLKKVGILKTEFLNGKLTIKESQLAKVSGREDPQILAIVNPLIENVSSQLKTVIGEAKVPLEGGRGSVRFQETAFGNLITAAIRKLSGSDIAILNSGGIREGINKGPITYGDVLRAIPFHNTIYVYSLKGADLFEYLKLIVKLAPGKGGFPQMSGIKIKTDPSDQITELKIDDADIDLQKTYKLAINNFMAQGGDNFPDLRAIHTVQDTHQGITDYLRAYIAQLKQIKTEDVQISGYYQRRVK